MPRKRGITQDLAKDKERDTLKRKAQLLRAKVAELEQALNTTKLKLQTMCAREEELKTASQMVRGWLDAVSTTVCMGSPGLGVVAEGGSKTESTEASSFTRGSSKLLSARKLSAGSPVSRDNFQLSRRVLAQSSTLD
ncbi:hypothetical protein LTS09_017746 [Friedmanniomyces endolithicus]|nr:hypothetical protein LTS09_017746 [Friedmanniomyces endolithicus]